MNIALCRAKNDPIRVDQLSCRPTMKTASISIDMVKYANQRGDMSEERIANTNPSPTPDTVVGDSWFSSMDLCEHIDTNYIGVIKTNHSRYCKAFLLKTMKPWPGGSHLLLKTVLNEGRRDEKVVYALGYKYCKSKVLFFIFTEGAGHTECKPEYAYEATWKDDNLNTLTRKIARPHVCDLYFRNCNAIDVANQSRQSELALEKHWITQCGFFRVVTTLFGMTVIDAWRGYVWHCGAQHRHKKIQMLDFVDLLCKDMLDNGYSRVRMDNTTTTYSICPPVKMRTPVAGGLLNNLAPGDGVGDDAGEFLAVEFQEEESPSSQMSDLTQMTLFPEPFARGATSVARAPVTHKLMATTKMESYGYDVTPVGTNIAKRTKGERTVRRKCHVCKKKTCYYCMTCFTDLGVPKWTCSNESCFGTHCTAYQRLERNPNIAGA